MEKKQRVWVDGRGQEVPASYVAKYDKERDRAVRKVLAGALRLRAQMEAFMADAVRTMDSLAKMKESLGERGNFSARSFDALIEVAIKQQYNVRLDGRVQKARELMLDYANRELAKAGEGAFLLKQMIEAAFKPDRYGFLPRGEINKLLGYRVKDATWNEGAALLRESLTTEAGKRYLRVSQRGSLRDDFRPVRLDIADCWPEEASVEKLKSSEVEKLKSSKTFQPFNPSTFQPSTTNAANVQLGIGNIETGNISTLATFSQKGGDQDAG